MSFNINTVFETTTFSNVTRGAVASVIGAAVAFGTTKWAALNSSSLSYLVPTFTTAYFAGVHLLEKKYPQFGWLLGLLPKSTPINLIPNVVTPPTPKPTTPPVVTIAAAKAPVAAKKAPAAKKAAPKKTGK